MALFDRVLTRNAGVMALALVLLPIAAWADAGVLIPSNNPQPDPNILSLAEMKMDIRIDNGVARVAIRQIFASHDPSILEGNWVFALPSRATISDFAVWDGVTRIPGVILERRRAGEIYENLKWQAIDPGLLQMGEYDAADARRTAVFSARVSPIPAYGTKRVEVEYHERIPVENLRAYFAVPLRPDAYNAQTAGTIEINLELRSQHAIRDFRAVGDTFPLDVAERGPHLIRAHFAGSQVAFNEDFAIEYALDPAAGDTLQVLTYRDPNPARPDPTELSPEPGGPAVGFFEASALLALPPVEVQPPQSGVGPPLVRDSSPPRTVVALFDNSLSMQWEKLERSYRALETLLLGLRPRRPLQPAAGQQRGARVSSRAGRRGRAHRRAGAGVREGKLHPRRNRSRARPRPGFGTMLQRNRRTLSGAADRRRRDAGDDSQRPAGGAFCRQAARHERANRRRVRSFSRSATTLICRCCACWRAARQPRPPRTKARVPGGVLEWVRSTEPIDFKLSAFLSKIGRKPLSGLRLETSPAENFDLVYPLEESWFSGSIASWVGRYLKPMAEAAFAVVGSRGGEPLAYRAEGGFTRAGI